MSDVSKGPGWWLASDGKWYPPRESEEPPGPGWWLASDGKWYPPESRSAATKPTGSSSATRTTSTAKEGQGSATGAKKPTGKKPVAGRRSSPNAEPDADNKVDARATAPAVTAAAAKAPAAKATNAKAPAAKAPGPKAGPRAKSPASGAPTTKAPLAKATGSKAPAAKPTSSKRPGPQEPVRAKSSSAAPAGPSGSPPDDQFRPRSTAGMSPEEQIERRNQASRADAVALAPSRFSAATRALASLSAELDRERVRSTAHEDQLSTLAMATPAPDAPIPAPAPKPLAPPGSGPANGASEKAARAEPRPTKTAPSAGGTEPPRSERSPLLEVKPSPIASDLSHVGDRLAIYNDRVELRDRSGKVRQVIDGGEITDVVIQKRVTGVILSIEGIQGPAIIAKGLTPKQAEDARALIMRKTRPVGPVERKAPATTTGSSSTAPEPRPAPQRDKIDEADLVRKLTDLHRAGILTDDEYDHKVDLVERMARGETLAPTKT